MKRAVVVAGLLAILGIVFWLKVQHAVGVCAEAHGRWVDGDCVFDEPRDEPRDAPRNEPSR